MTLSIEVDSPDYQFFIQKELNMEENYFVKLSALDFSDQTKRKNGLSYLSWAYAWRALKTNYPTANYKVYEREDGRNYWDDTKTCWVKVGVTVENIEHIEYLAIMDNRNKSVPVETVTSVQVINSIQRALTKAIGRHGIGLYIYAGEDLPVEAGPDIDITLAQAAATNIKDTTTSIADLQKQVSKMIIKLSDTSANEIVVNSIQTMLNGIRVSQTTEKDRDNLVSTKAFLGSIGQQLKISFDE